MHTTINEFNDIPVIFYGSWKNRFCYFLSKNIENLFYMK